MRAQWQITIVILIISIVFPSYAAPPANTTTPAATSSCTPSNCTTICSPQCLPTEACIIGTMIKCGVCPLPTCVQRTLLGQTPVSSATVNSEKKTNNGPLIGGLVGGLVGGALLFAGIGFAVLRYRRNQNRLGFAFQSPLPRYDNSKEPKPRVSQETVSTYTRAVPFSRADRLVIVHERIVPNAGELPGNDHQASQADNPSRQSNPNQDTNSLYVPNEDSDDDDDESRCSSLHSGQNIPIKLATMSQAAKIVYKKPQVMRVNTIKSIDQNMPSSSLQRGGSVRAILTKDKDHPTNDSNLARSKTMPLKPKKRMVSPIPNDKDLLSPNHTFLKASRPVSAPLQAIDDPFHDRHSICSDQDRSSQVSSSSSYGTKKRTSYEPKLKDMKYESMQSMSEFESEFPWPPMEMPPITDKIHHST
ncbi:hypothetical protein CLU79DRAFT_719507 [Phycomyces nitens]|nr:hypothetical protein CLU79DRAFT_719507 [Phycomyces nitens]